MNLPHQRIPLLSGLLATLGAVLLTPPAGAQRDVALARSLAPPAAASAAVVVTGHVVLPDGTPAERAVVVTSAGGRAVTDERGAFELALDVPLDAESVQVTAAGTGAQGSLVASARVGPLALGGRTSAGRLVLEAAASCQASWLPTFGGLPDTDGAVHAFAVFDDGTGPALYAGGDFESAGGFGASRIAKWDGARWTALGTGLDVGPRALAVFDDGGGPALYAGGWFTSAGGSAASGIAKWDGSSWSALGSGTDGTGGIAALAVLDDGGGPALYAGGHFTSAGGVAANRIARWDGSSWSALGSGTDLSVLTLAVFDDGGGPALYAGGHFTSAGGVAANRIARWDGSSWTGLGSGLTGGVEPCVHALAVFDDGGGAALYAAGQFASAGGVAANRIAEWNGASWSALGGGTSGPVTDLVVFDDGSGAALCAGGVFAVAGGAAANGIAKWDGSSWSALGSGIDGAAGISGLVVFDGGGGPELHAAGYFESASAVAVNWIGKWNGSSWSALGPDGDVNGGARSLATFDDGSGPALYAGGAFDEAGGVAAKGIAAWDGSSWSPLGSGLGGVALPAALALVVHDDGSGPALYAGGDFTTAGAAAASYVARWDGSSWSPLGSGMDYIVGALAVFDDGSGPALYAGGDFTAADGAAASKVAKWDGSSWSALASGTNDAVSALAVFDDGGGAALYAGGSFAIAGGIPASGVARWDGSSWSALGSGMDQPVLALAVFDDGGGPALYAGGRFQDAGGVPANHIAKWDGASWSAVGGGMNHRVTALAVFDGGDGPALYAGGLFGLAGGVVANGMARWDGSTWSPLGSGVSGLEPSVEALASFDDGVGASLYAGGSFTASPAGDSFLAEWGCPAITSLPGCAGNPASLAALAAGAPLGSALQLRITGSAAVSGVGQVYAGTSGMDGSGCGLAVAGVGELLLAIAPPMPVFQDASPLVGGVSDCSVGVPTDTALTGQVFHLQGLAVDPAAALPVELTNALVVKLGP